MLKTITLGPYSTKDNLRKKKKKHERKKENKWATESNTSNIMAQLINRTEGNLPLSEPRQRTSTPSLSALIWLVCVCVFSFGFRNRLNALAREIGQLKGPICFIF